MQYRLCIELLNSLVAYENLINDIIINYVEKMHE